MNVKMLIQDAGFTLTEVSHELERRRGSTYTVQNLSNRIRKDQLKLVEFLEILEIIGLKIEIKSHSNNFKS